MKMISVAKEFSRFPSGRKIAKGNTSGEAFRQKFLEPFIKSMTPVIIDLDGTIGYGSSFLEEAFGGAVRATGTSVDDFFELIHLKSSNKLLLKEIRQYVTEASKHPAY